MKLPYVNPLIEKFKQWLNRPVEQMGRWQRSARFLIELGRHCYDEMLADRAPEMAAALTYRTIFGLIPFFVVALLVFRAFGGFASYGPHLQEQIYQYLNLTSISVHQQDKEQDPSSDQKAQDAGDSPAPSKASQSSGRPPSESTTQQEAPSPGGDRATTGGEQPATTHSGQTTADSESGSPQATATSKTGSGQDEEKVDQAEIEQILNQLDKRVQNVSFTSIGMVGLILLLWAAISLVVNVEHCFNQVFQSTAGRSWVKRITIYWAVITLGPVLVALSLYLSSAVVDTIQRFAQSGASGGGVAVISPLWAYLMGIVLWILEMVTRLAGLLVTVLLLFLLYMLLPNTKVRARAAIIGATAAAVLWEIAKYGFGVYVNKAVGVSALYGSLGLIPLFLLWLYLTWLIVVLGLELTYTLQAMRGGRFQRLRASADAATDMDPRWLIALMAVVGDTFEHGDTISDGDIAGELGLPIAVVRALGKRLEEAGLLHEVEQRSATMEGSQWSLARPADQITVQRLMEVGEGLANQRRSRHELPASSVLRAIHEAQHDAVGDRTLATVIVNDQAA